MIFKKKIHVYRSRFRSFYQTQFNPLLCVDFGEKYFSFELHCSLLTDDDENEYKTISISYVRK